MTEEIIIDGVNVARCKHYDLENNYCDQSYLGEGGLLKNTKNPKRCGCSPNCYYKQLKRLEQENKELMNENNKLRLALEEINILVKNYCNACDEFKAKTYKNKNDCLYCNYGFIKRKINEVLNHSEG